MKKGKLSITWSKTFQNRTDPLSECCGWQPSQKKQDVTRPNYTQTQCSTQVYHISQPNYASEIIKWKSTLNHLSPETKKLNSDAVYISGPSYTAIYNPRTSSVPHILQLILFIFPSTKTVFNYQESNLGSFIPYQINTAVDMATLHISEMF